MMCWLRSLRRKKIESKFIFENGTEVYSTSYSDAVNKLYSNPKFRNAIEIDHKTWYVSFEKGIGAEVNDCDTLDKARQQATWRMYLDKRDPCLRRG
jgi:hypothetical protein